MLPPTTNDKARAYPALALQYGTNYAILFGAHLVAVQIRLKLPWGNRLGSEYQAQPPEFLLLMALSLGIAYGLAWLAKQNTRLAKGLKPGHQFRVLLVALALALVLTLILVPDLSILQLVYFAVVTVVLGIGVIVWPSRLALRSDGRDFFVNIARVWKARFLILLWLRYNIQVRYSQTALGILWIILLPLSTAAVISLAFTQFLHINTDVPFVAFLLSALVPWGLFNQGIQNGLLSVLSRMGLLNQVYFPRETLVLLVMGEALVDFVFTLGAMLILNALNGIWPSIYFIYLPLLLSILICFVVGLAFFLSCLTVMVRDIPQLVSVGLQLLFYLTPIIYPVEAIPDRFQIIILLNPLTQVIQAFRDVIVYRRPPDLITLHYPLVVALALLYMGYVFFKANEERLTDYS